MAKRIASSSINWTSIMEALLPADKATVAPLKSSAEKYIREISSKPAELPKIDWSFYKSRISAPGMVDAFQKSYEGLTVPYPSDQGNLSKIESSNTKMIKHANDKYAEVVKKKEELKAKLQELEKVLKFSDSTIEELYLAKPELRNNPDNPKLWPHLSKFQEEKPSDH